MEFHLPGHRGSHAAANGGADPGLEAALESLDRTLIHLRRAIARPDAAAIPVPSLGRPVDIAKVYACTAIADLAAQGPPTVSAVAQELGLEHSTASRLLSESESEGLIRRRTDPADRRRTVVELTDDGAALVADSAQIRTWLIGHLLADWDTRDITMLADLLERFEATFERCRSNVLASALERFGEAHVAATHE